MERGLLEATGSRGAISIQGGDGYRFRLDGYHAISWHGCGTILSGVDGDPLVPPQSGGYEFVLLGACHASFSVDGVALIHRFEGGSETVHKSVELEAGRPMSFEWN